VYNLRIVKIESTSRFVQIITTFSNSKGYNLDIWCAIFSITAFGLSGANKYSTIDPITLWSKSHLIFTTNVYKPSWSSYYIFDRKIIKQLHKFPNLSWIRHVVIDLYMASCALWKPPTPTWTIPVLTFLYCNVGTETPAVSWFKLLLFNL
jgi:hypothetical protein